jgi:hypothetical protein
LSHLPRIFHWHTVYALWSHTHILQCRPTVVPEKERFRQRQSHLIVWFSTQGDGGRQQAKLVNYFGSHHQSPCPTQRCTTPHLSSIGNFERQTGRRSVLGRLDNGAALLGGVITRGAIRQLSCDTKGGVACANVVCIFKNERQNIESMVNSTSHDCAMYPSRVLSRTIIASWLV